MDMALAFIEKHRKLPQLADLPESLSALMLTPRFEASCHVIFIIFPSGKTQPLLVAKIPRMPQLGERLTHEASVLKTIQKLRTGGFQSIPQVINYDYYQGYPVLLETALNGRLISPEVIRRDPERIIQITRDWLLEIQSNSTGPHDDHWYEVFVESPLLALRDIFPLTTKERDLVNQCEQYLVVLKETSLPYVLEHGDLSHPNLILTEHGSLGVLDWELATIRGLIASDLFFFLGYAAFSLHHANESGDYIQAFDRAFFDRGAWAQPHIHEYKTALTLETNTVPALFLLSWLRYLVQFIGRLHLRKTEYISLETADIVRKHRSYALWKHAVEQFRRLSIG